MFDLRYNKLKTYEEKFNGKIEVLGGDTDSLICLIKNIDLYNELHPAMIDDGLLDTSNYPNNHPLFSNQFKAKLGCIKDEVPGEVIKQAILLKPKCYSISTVSGKGKKMTAKGVQFCIRDKFTHEQYYEICQRQKEFACNV